MLCFPAWHRPFPSNVGLKMLAVRPHSATELDMAEALLITLLMFQCAERSFSKDSRSHWLTAPTVNSS